MKKKFEEMTLEIVFFEEQDVITASGDSGTEGNENELPKLPFEF